MKRVNLNLLILFLILIGVALMMGRTEPRQQESSARTPAAVPPLESAAAKMLAPTTEIYGVKPPPVVPAPVKVEHPFAKELGEYAILKRKVFLSPSEDATRRQLIGSEKILRGLRTRLLRSPENAREAAEQNAAIDMLLEAARAGNSEVAVDVLRSVVTDGQVEDEDLDRATRENLAGVKAEVLYQWSALKPAQASELANLLPGPVSQRIWQNVVDAQVSNLHESAALAH